MIKLSNKQAFNYLKEHQDFQTFLENFKTEQYPGLTLEQVYTLIMTGVVVKGMNLESTIKISDDIKAWVSKRSHGGLRKRAGRKKSNKEFSNITLNAEKADIQKAKAKAKENGSSLQREFRKWLVEMGT